MYDKSLGQALGYGQRFVPGRLGKQVRPQGVDVQTPQAPKPMITAKGRVRPGRTVKSPLQRAIYPQV